MVDRYKQALRITYRSIREKLSLTFQQTASDTICARALLLNQYHQAKHIALYHPINGEVDLISLWKSASLQGKYCYFPLLNDDRTLSFVPATPATSFSKNHLGIAEPMVERDLAIEPQQLDIIFMPLVAFDYRGTRLGMGAGYYDRTLAQNSNPLLIGVAYEFQRQPFIEAQPWDVPMDVVITEQTIYWSKL